MKDKYIFIISKDVDDSTNIVMKWLDRFGVKVIRTGDYIWIKSIEIKKTNSVFDVTLNFNTGISLKMEQIIGFWYRKSILPILKGLEIILPNDYSIIKEEYIDYLEKEESGALKQFLIHEFEKINHLGNIKAENGNKLIAFRIAEEVGLKTPDFLISSDSNKLNKRLKKGGYIVKPIQDGFQTYNEGILFKNYYSNTFDLNMFKNIENEIFPSCIQNYISKKIEIRTFYIKGEMYSMAIFSQSNKETEVDFRNYSEDKPNRNVPFKLPNQIENKIHLLMDKLGLNTGSIDLILTPSNDYVFLEVNPSGQYGMIEASCFYGLDKLISKELVNK